MTSKEFLLQQNLDLNVQKLSDNKIHILRPVTEQQKSRIPVSNSQHELNDSSFFILGSVRNVPGKKTADKSNIRTHKLITNKTQSKQSSLKVAQSFTREKSLPAKIEDELEKAKIRAQNDQPYAPFSIKNKGRSKMATTL